VQPRRARLERLEARAYVSGARVARGELEEAREIGARGGPALELLVDEAAVAQLLGVAR